MPRRRVLLLQRQVQSALQAVKPAVMLLLSRVEPSVHQIPLAHARMANVLICLERPFLAQNHRQDPPLAVLSNVSNNNQVGFGADINQGDVTTPSIDAGETDEAITASDAFHVKASATAMSLVILAVVGYQLGILNGGCCFIFKLSHYHSLDKPMDARCSSLTVPRTETFAFLFDVLQANRGFAAQVV